MKKAELKAELTAASIVAAVEAGARNVSAVARAHGYPAPVSGGVTARIRALVPNVAELIAEVASGAAKPKAPVAPVAPVAPAEQAESASKAAKIEEGIPAQPVKPDQPVKPAQPVRRKTEKSEPGRERPLVEVGQRKAPFRGNVYPLVFAEAVAAGLTSVRTFVEVTARKLNLDENSVLFATNVMRIPKHASNGGRCKDVAGKRGFMRVVEIAEADM